MGEGAFEYCGNLVNMTIPATVEYIGEGAFEYCERLADITIPASVGYIGEGAFSNCHNLNSVIFEEPTGWFYGNYVAHEIELDMGDPQLIAKHFSGAVDTKWEDFVLVREGIYREGYEPFED